MSNARKVTTTEDLENLCHSILAEVQDISKRVGVLEAMASPRHNLLRPEATKVVKTKSVKAVKVAKATKRIDIEGHPTRATWTDQMKEASTEAYKASKGDYQARNRAGVLAAQAVA